MFKGLGDITNLLSQAQQMQGRLNELQQNLGQLRVEGNAGGGMVKVSASGEQRILSVDIDKSLLESGDREMLEDLVIAATNHALKKAKEAAAQEMAKLTGELEIPGLGDALSKLGMGTDGSGTAG
jgi:hypothetical protein